MLVVEVPHDLITSAASNIQTSKEESIPMPGGQGNHVENDLVVLDNSALPKCGEKNCANSKDTKSVRIDISFKSPSHTGLQTTELVIFYFSIKLKMLLKYLLSFLSCLSQLLVDQMNTFAAVK